MNKSQKGLSMAVVVIILVVSIGFSSVLGYWVVSTNERIRQLEERGIMDEYARLQIGQVLNKTRELVTGLESVKENEQAILQQLSAIEQELAELEVRVQEVVFEKVEISWVTCGPKDRNGVWWIGAGLKNIGSVALSLNSVFVDQYETKNGYDPTILDTSTVPTTDIWCSLRTPSQTLLLGESIAVTIWIKQGFATFSSGTTLNIKFHSVRGIDYVKVVELV